MINTKTYSCWPTGQCTRSCRPSSGARRSGCETILLYSHGAVIAGVRAAPNFSAAVSDSSLDSFVGAKINNSLLRAIKCTSDCNGNSVLSKPRQSPWFGVYIDFDYICAIWFLHNVRCRIHGGPLYPLIIFLPIILLVQF